jgi:hypothetical protein
MKEHVDAVAEYEYEADIAAGVENAEAEKAIFKRNMMRKKLATYLKMNEIEEEKVLAKLELSKMQKEEQ